MKKKGGPIEQTWLKFSKIPSHLKKAVLLAEDSRFYEHPGVDVIELQESFKKNWREKRFARGFSTITMQLVKNLFLSENKTLFRKGLEILIALRLELTLKKDRILEIYLNVIEWGRGIYGVEEAANHYFHKSASQLTPAESAFLAAIIPSPKKWGRLPPGRYVQKRTAMLLQKMGQFAKPSSALGEEASKELEAEWNKEEEEFHELSDQPGEPTQENNPGDTPVKESEYILY